MKKIHMISIFSGILLLGCGNVQANGFGVKLNSTQLGGQAFAGSGVSADPLAAFNNPAAAILSMTHEAAVQATAVLPYVKLRANNGSAKSIQAGVAAGVPASAFTAKLHDRVRFNINISSPFGLKFDYGNKPSIANLRYYSVKASMMTINVNPNLAVRVTDYLSVGAGFQAMYSDVILKQGLLLPSSAAAVQGVMDNFLATSKVRGDDWGYGWTAGLLLEPTKCWKVGLSYRSKVSTTLKGKLKFKNVTPALDFIANVNPGGLVGAGTVALLTPGLTDNDNARAALKYPDYMTISSSLKVHPQWTLLMDALYTGWKSLKEIKITTTTASQTKIVPQKWTNKWFFSLGANYELNDCWLLRGGVAYDLSPTKAATRVPSIPDSDKLWLALGATYSFSKNSSMSFSYGHESFKKAHVNQTYPSEGATVPAKPLNARIKAHVNLVGVQFNYKF